MKNYFWIIVMFVLAGCSPNSKLETISVTPSPSTPSPTNTLTATQLAVPTFTLTSTLIPSHPISTPSAKESAEITLELLRTNNGCDLPCWWGIVPNKTSWNDVKFFLKSFSTIYERQPPNEWFVYDIRSPISEEFSELSTVAAVVATRDGIVKEIEISGFNEKLYYLSSILWKYGVPSQVLVSTYSSDYGLPPNQVPLSLDIYYPDKGINVLYGANAIVQGAQIRGCLEDPHLFLWSPLEQNRSIDYILGWDKHDIPYLDIEQVAGITVQDFYEKYSHSENAPCIETPTTLWPAQ